jgi:transcriptional regulator with XRE-family HTH domain
VINITRLGDFLKELRGTKSLREIEKTSGVSYSYLRRIENGIDPRSGKEFIPSPDTLKKLAKAYDYDYIDLMDMAGYLSNLSNVEKENLEINYDFQETLEDNYYKYIKKIVSEENFIPHVRDEIKNIEEKYEKFFEENEHLTPAKLKNLISSVTWKDEWIFNLFNDLLIITRNYVVGDVKELTEFLSLSNISYNYKLLSENDRKRILDMLKVLFPDEKEN